MVRAFIKDNIINNDYYTNIRHIYNTIQSEDHKEYVINAILNAFTSYDSYFSVYTIMDSIEDFLDTHEDIWNIYDAIEHKDFMIKERY